MARVWRDERGLFVRVDGYVARPGKVPGYSYNNDMSDGGLKEGDNIPARHLAGSPLVRVNAPFGTVIWLTTDELGYRRIK